jgi:hypothetical protein
MASRNVFITAWAPTSACSVETPARRLTLSLNSSRSNASASWRARDHRFLEALRKLRCHVIGFSSSVMGDLGFVVPLVDVY